MKRFISLLLLVALLLTAFPLSASASKEKTTEKLLLELCSRFPHGMYWNHVGSSKNDPDCVTDTPCTNHANISWDSPEKTCNSFDNAIQCMGFAHKIGFEIVGTSPRTWEKSEKLVASKLRVGDIIRYRDNRHSLTVTAVKGNTISFVDANWYYGCGIRWAKMDLSDMPGFSYVLHDKSNNRKNTNVDFYLTAVEKGEQAFAKLEKTTERWRAPGKSALKVYSSFSAPKSKLGEIPLEAYFRASDKKIVGKKVWGKVKYGALSGWAVLNQCEFVSGNVNAAKVIRTSSLYPSAESFDVSWSAVPGAAVYRVDVAAEYGSYSATLQANTNSISLFFPQNGRYYVTVTALNSRIPSWSVESEPYAFSAVNKSEIKLSSVKLSKSTVTLLEKGSLNLFAEVSPSFAGNKRLTWKSSNELVVSVSQSGKLTALSPGKATVSCTSSDGSQRSAFCAVTVLPSAVSGVYQKPGATKAKRLTVYWEKVNGADGYEFYRYDAKAKKYVLLCETKKTRAVCKGLEPGNKYVFAVRAFKTCGNERLYGAMSKGRTLLTNPAAPSVLAKTSGKKTVISWNSVPGATGYEIYTLKGKEFVLAKVLSASRTSYSKKYAKRGQCFVLARTRVDKDIYRSSKSRIVKG